MPSLSVRAVPGWSVVILSDDLSLDASTLRFHVDQTGKAAFAHDVNGLELFLNISCEAFGPNGSNCLRISIDGPDSPQWLYNTISCSATTYGSQFPDTMAMEYGALGAQALERPLMSSANQYPSLLPSQSSTVAIPSAVNSGLSGTGTGVSTFDFDWSTVPCLSEEIATNSDATSISSFGQTGKADSGHFHYSGNVSIAAEQNTYSGSGIVDESYMNTTFQQPMPMGEPEFNFKLLIPPENTACSEGQNDDKDMHSESDSNDEKDNEESHEYGQEMRNFSSSRGARPGSLGVKSQKAKPPRVFTCSVLSCNVKTSRRHDLLRHEVKKHGKKSNWQCEFCQTFFSSEKTQERHICSKKMIQSNKSGGSTGCWKLPSHMQEEQSV